MITAEQKAHWDAFGFLVLRQLFAPDEVKELRQVSIEVMKQCGGDNPFSGPDTWSLGAFVERHPVLTEWLVDDRFYSIPETLLGPDFLLDQTMESGGLCRAAPRPHRWDWDCLQRRYTLAWFLLARQDSVVQANYTSKDCNVLRQPQEGLWLPSRNPWLSPESLR